MRIKSSVNHYQVLKVPKDASLSTIKSNYREIVNLLNPRNCISELETALTTAARKACIRSYKVLTVERDRLEYDIQLLKGEGTIDTEIRNSLVEKYNDRTSGPLLAILMAFNIFLLFFLLSFKLFKGILVNLAKVFKFHPKRQMKWCDNCEEYHVVSTEEGSVWEMNGKYFYRRSGVHDITDLVKSGFFAQQQQQPEQEGDKEESETILTPLEESNRLAKAKRNKKIRPAAIKRL